MKPHEQLQLRLGECPLVAILRGIRPDEVEAIGTALYEAGFRIIEIPLNSPSPLDSIARLARLLGERALVGAGTVLLPDDVGRVRDAGGRLIVSPDTNREVIAATVEADMVSAPGFFTPSEAVEAIRAGAHGLKFFPAEAATPAVLKAQLTILPAPLPVLVVGGIQPDNMQRWLDVGASGFGLGSGLYRPGQSAAETEAKASAYLAGSRR